MKGFREILVITCFFLKLFSKETLHVQHLISCLPQPHLCHFLPSALFPLLSHPQWDHRPDRILISVLIQEETQQCIASTPKETKICRICEWSYSRCVQVERGWWKEIAMSISWLVRFTNSVNIWWQLSMSIAARSLAAAMLTPSSLHQVSAAALEVVLLFQNIIKSLWWYMLLLIQMSNRFFKASWSLGFNAMIWQFSSLSLHYVCFLSVF